MSPIGSTARVHAFFADQAHITEQAGIAGQINLFTGLGGEQEAGRVAAIGAVRQPRAMHRLGQLEVTEGVFVPAADVLPVGVNPLRLQPVGDLKIGDHWCACAPGDAQRVADVIPVPVGEQDEVGLRLRAVMDADGLPSKKGSISSL